MNFAVRYRTRRASCLAAIVGAALALATVAVVGVIVARRNAIPPLDRPTLEAAWQLWQTKAPADYDISVQVVGRQPATYSVSVRGSQVVSADRNGHPLLQRRTIGTWSVPGMFGTIETDLDNHERRQSDADRAQTPQLVLRAEFDPEWGYPRQYQRIELQTQNEVRWHVTSFRVQGSTEHPAKSPP